MAVKTQYIPFKTQYIFRWHREIKKNSVKASVETVKGPTEFRSKNSVKTVLAIPLNIDP